MPNIDERVVEMRFDNRQFERGVQTSLNSLSALKKGLDMNGAARGLTELEKAGNNFSLAGMATAVDHIVNKFSVLGIAGFTVIQDLTRSAMNMARQITSQFTIDPLKTGFAEYETQINSVQTILANTQKEGTNLQQVTAALDELNKYADMTIYNFTEMTRNIGTFTAAGVKLDTAVNAIQGIANLAAISGSTSQQASTAMYQLSQAMASGTVKLMDWNSVVNAGMGGQVFQDALTETARVHGIKIDQMIQSQGSFRETLQKGWLTTDILTETLEKFTATTDGLTEAQVEQNRAMWKARGYTEEQIDAIYEMGQMSTEAATKVKTFTQLVDTLKESAQSGWTQTWETIVGDFEEAKELFTEISEIVGGIINRSAQSRNDRLFGGLTSGWKQLMSQGIDDVSGFEDMVLEIVKERSGAIQKGAKSASESFQLLNPEMDETVSIVDLDKWIKTDGGFEESLKRGWLNADLLGESIDRFTKKLSGMSEEERKAAGYSQEMVDKLVLLSQKIQNGEVSLETFSKMIAMTSGRENLIDGLRNSFQALMNILNPIGTAFKIVFTPATSEQIYNITGAVSSFTKKLAEGSAAISGRVQTVFEGFFSLVAIGVKAVLALANGTGDLLSRLQPVADSLLNLASNIGTYLTALNASVDETDIFGKSIQKVTGFLAPFVDMASHMISEFFNNLPGAVSKGISAFATFGTKTGVVFSNISKAFLDVFSGPDFFQSIATAFNTGILASILLGVKKFLTSLTETIDNGKGFLKNLQNIFDGITGSLEALQQSLKADTLIKIATALAIFTAALVVLAMIDPSKLASSLTAIGVMLTELMASMSFFTKIVGNSNAKGLMKANFALLTIATSVLILAAAVRIMANLSWEQLLVGLVGVGAILAEIAIFAKSTDSGIGVKQAVGLIALGAAVNVLAIAVKRFTEMDPSAMLSGLMAVGALLVGLSWFSNSTAKAKNVTSTAVGMVILGGAILVFGQAIKMIGSLSIPTLATGIIAMGAALFLIAGAVNLLPQSGMVGIGVGMLGIATALLILSNAIQTIGQMPFDQVATGLVGLGVSLLAIAATMQYMNGTLSGAASLLVVAAAIWIFVPALQALGSMPVSTIITGLVTLAAAFAIIGVAAALLTPVVPAMLGMAGAMALIGVSVATVAAGVWLFSAALGALATMGAVGAAAIVAALSTITVGIIQLIPLVCVAIGEGIIAIAGVIGGSAMAISEAVVAVVTAVVFALTECAPVVADGALQLILTLITLLAVYTPQIASAGIELVIGLITAISSQLPSLVNAGMTMIVSFINGIANGIRENGSSILAAIGNLISSIIEFALVALAEVARLIPGVGEEMANGILDMRDQVQETLASDAMQNAGTEAMEGMAEGITEGASDVKAAGEHAAEQGVVGASSEEQGFFDAGSFSGEGFVEGIISQLGAAEGAGADIAQAAYEAAMRALDEHSPSKKLRKVGANGGLGFVLGLKDMFASSAEAGRTLATDSMSAMGEALSNLADYLGTNLDSSPTIRPVMDLSEIRNGVQSIGSMFSATRGLNLSPVAAKAAVAMNRDNADKSTHNDHAPFTPVARNVTFNQYNNSPKALSRIEIYRQTHNQLSQAKEVLGNV